MLVVSLKSERLTPRLVQEDETQRIPVGTRVGLTTPAIPPLATSIMRMRPYRVEPSRLQPGGYLFFIQGRDLFGQPIEFVRADEGAERSIP